jgi:hypothetical protein
MPGAEHLCPDCQPGDEIGRRDQEENFLDGFIATPTLTARDGFPGSAAGRMRQCQGAARISPGRGKSALGNDPGSFQYEKPGAGVSRS